MTDQVDYTVVNVQNYVRFHSEDDSPWTMEQILTARVLMEEEHPRRINPSVRSLLRSIVKNDESMSRNGSFQPGDWVEVMGPDMKWKLDMVEKALPIGNSGEFIYKVGPRGQLKRIELRAPEEGLLRVFGSRPWIWQQWALLKVENLLRFHEGHPHDFERLDIPEYARYLWLRWINDPDNYGFLRQLDDLRLASASELLFDHIMKPFYILDEIRREERWDFTDDVFSVFSYMSLLGKGAFPVCLFCIIMQFVIPLLLLMESLTIANYDTWAKEDDRSYFDYVIKIFCVTDDEAQCTRLRVTTLMIGGVQMLYLLQVGPDMAAKFAQIIGAGRFVPEYSVGRVNAMRQIVREKNEDRIEQKFGLFLDFYMNSLYVYLLFILNLYNIFSKVDPFEVLYNAIALEFVYLMDENYVSLTWWDHDRRFLKAGVMEVALQGQVNITALACSKEFARLFDVAQRIVLEACENDSWLLNSVSQSNVDSENIKYMDKSELHDYFVTKKLKENSLWNHEFIKQPVDFGSFGKSLDSLHNIFSGQHRSTIFDRYRSFRTWSRWNKVLFIAEIPKVDELFEKDANGNQIIQMELERRKATEEEPFRNFDRDVGTLDFDEFVKKRKADVLSGRALRRNLIQVLRKGKYPSVLLQSFTCCIDGAFQWLAYFLQLSFPTINLVLLFLQGFCWARYIDILENDSAETRCNCQLVSDEYPAFKQMFGIFDENGLFLRYQCDDLLDFVLNITLSGYTPEEYLAIQQEQQMQMQMQQQ
uniref:Uncharacterized protein n=1 Tax=Leptocylindrus danicus TaxID=163516 RepID=A0A7S2NW82_9STRA